MRKRRRQETQCCVCEPTRGVKTRAIPQSERMTHGTDTEIQKETQTSASGSSVRTPMTDIRNTDQPETGNDEFENLGEWTPAKRIQTKSRPLVQSKRPRETPADLEHMESDEQQRMGTGSSANETKSDQPEVATVKEQRVYDIAIDRGPQDASMTKMRMDEMLMDQAMALCHVGHFTRLFERGKARASDNKRIAPRSCKGQAREMKDLDDMNVLEWVKAPNDAKILECGWAMKMKSPSEV